MYYFKKQELEKSATTLTNFDLKLNFRNDLKTLCLPFFLFFFLAHKLWDDGNGLAVLKIAGNYFLGWCSVTGARQ